MQVVISTAFRELNSTAHVQ